jgi:hypothetical protein
MSSCESHYTLHLPENMCVDLFDEHTNYSKDLMNTNDVLYELMTTHYTDNVVKKNSYEE